MMTTPKWSYTMRLALNESQTGGRVNDLLRCAVCAESSTGERKTSMTFGELSRKAIEMHTKWLSDILFIHGLDTCVIDYGMGNFTLCLPKGDPLPRSLSRLTWLGISTIVAPVDSEQQSSDDRKTNYGVVMPSDRATDHLWEMEEEEPDKVMRIYFYVNGNQRDGQHDEPWQSTKNHVFRIRDLSAGGLERDQLAEQHLEDAAKKKNRYVQEEEEDGQDFGEERRHEVPVSTDIVDKDQAGEKNAVGPRDDAEDGNGEQKEALKKKKKRGRPPKTATTSKADGGGEPETPKKKKAKRPLKTADEPNGDGEHESPKGKIGEVLKNPVASEPDGADTVEMEEDNGEQAAEEQKEKPPVAVTTRDANTNKEAQGHAKGPNDDAAGKPKKKKKDPNAPKGVRPTYNYFVQAKRESVKASHPELDFKETNKFLGQLWKQLTAVEKEVYEEQHNRDKLRYAREMKVYQAKEKDGVHEPPGEDDARKKPALSSKKKPSRNNEDSQERVLVYEGVPTETVLGGWSKGWKKMTYQRGSGASKGGKDSYWISPNGTKFRSMKEVKKYLEVLAGFSGDEDQAGRAYTKKKTSGKKAKEESPVETSDDEAPASPKSPAKTPAAQSPKETEPPAPRGLKETGFPSPAKRPRGRPKGSKNKPKEAPAEK
mmetsp:Transcript_31734/g.74280  ORF Transcript_31734/g.74280 Transcript_31734/m.74280 type:complete len:655 (-) Transcript_31734:42-2006(-)